MNLIDAAESGDIDAIRRLLDGGADVNIKDKDWGFGPLHSAAGTGRSDIAELLLARGAIVDAKDSTGATPLHEAAKRGHVNVAELLIARGANVNTRTNQDDMTPLQMTIELNPKKEMETLLRKHGGTQ